MNEAMKQALEALEMVVVDVKTTPTAYEAHRQAIAALRTAIEAAEKPVAVSDAEIEAWAERHDIQGTATDLRCMFEDAAAELRRSQSVETESKERILRLEEALVKEVAINAQLLEALEAMRERLAQPELEPDAYGYAKRLAIAIWEQHYKATAPQWKPFDDLMGVLTQIDNMTAGLTTPTAAPVLEPVAWREFDGEGGYTYSDYQYNETWRDAYIKRNGEKYANWVEPLYTAAPAAQRTWVGLTDKEILSDDTLRYYYGLNGGSGPVSQKGKKVIAAIEAKLKEKNHD